MIFLPSQSEFMRFLDGRLATVGLTLDRLGGSLATAIDRTAATFALDTGKDRCDADGRPMLRTGHYSQMVLFLHNLSRAAYLAGDLDVADRVYFLNVSQSACDLLYEVDLPRRTHCDHPLGTIVGRGRFAAEAVFVFADGCCIGNNWGVYPQIDGRLVMSARSAVIGDTVIRGTVVLARGATLIDAGVIEDCLVFGAGSDLAFKPLPREKAAALIPFAEPPEV